ncbi:hypothetical protein [Helicobacter pylori]|uniref:Uncharacterized protein n=2 Tax=Helicobacter pylori TaxID=210 RepID=A0A1V3AQN8_HELPX|nr:hypothetical protein [Helicobacter pylori]ADU82275.1 hypothetical protein HPGAM_07510 [Helicobacter pylori Gambia94/24]EJB48799.1 hypothetical protein HPHPH16_0965 [Helicobacter pylori Hp H-16]EJB65529.1 hypothetical protein HPHPH44_0922 [Helicobacter pylori Hp H-44]EJB79245.1 hypothetical protein HPHPH4_1199 [Helicobacter pylori Hp H-4]EJC54801.1 hypothetical protein HPHPP62_1140 [Helicobacter pylori Hp P-62]
MQKEVLVEKPNPLTISYNLKQAISSLKSSVNALMKKEAHLDAYILVTNIRNIVDELHKEVVLANQSNKNTPKRKRKSP